MPIWLRKFHIQKINDFNKKQNEEIKNIEKGTNSNPNKITKPNINPSSTYNF